MQSHLQFSLYLPSSLVTITLISRCLPGVLVQTTRPSVPSGCRLQIRRRAPDYLGSLFKSRQGNMMHGEVIAHYLLLDNRHSLRSTLACVCACVSRHTHACEWVCISPGGNFDLIPSIQKNNVLWAGACCQLFFFYPSLLGPHLDESLYIQLLYNSLLRCQTARPGVTLMDRGAHRSRLVTQARQRL